MKTILAGLLASLVVIAAPAAHAAQLLVNGGFESGLSGWTVSNSNHVRVVADLVSPEDDLLRFLGPNYGKASLSQSFQTLAGATYDFSFNGGVFGGGPRQVAVHLATIVGGDVVTTPVGAFSLAPASNASGFSDFSSTFEGTGGAHTLMFEVGTAAGVSMFLDDISITQRVVIPPPSAAPEPSTWAMLILGFVAVGASLRNRRRRIA